MFKKSKQLLNDSEISNLDALQNLINSSDVIAIGEGAHFIEEFNTVRCILSKRLIEKNNLKEIALECSQDQAEKINFYLKSKDKNLLNHVNPLTYALYGSFLSWLKIYINESGKTINIIGIDLPNTLNPQKELNLLSIAFKSSSVFKCNLINEIKYLSNSIIGESAVVSANQWMELTPSIQNQILALITELEVHVKAYEPLIDITKFQKIILLIETVKYTFLNLKSMASLFSGTALEGETSIRDYFMAQSVERWIKENPNSKLIILAHNNHIQKTPISFAEELTAIPMGQYLSDKVKYMSIALTHLDKELHEMVYPSPNILGFSLEKIEACPMNEHSIENHIMKNTSPHQATYLELDAKTTHLTHIRSQSSQVTTVLNTAFNSVICLSSITLDSHCRIFFNQMDTKLTESSS